MQTSLLLVCAVALLHACSGRLVLLRQVAGAPADSAQPSGSPWTLPEANEVERINPLLQLRGLGSKEASGVLALDHVEDAKRNHLHLLLWRRRLNGSRPEKLAGLQLDPNGISPAAAAEGRPPARGRVVAPPLDTFNASQLRRNRGQRQSPLHAPPTLDVHKSDYEGPFSNHPSPVSVPPGPGFTMNRNEAQTPTPPPLVDVPATFPPGGFWN